MAERENPVIIIGGVRYRKEDAARLGLTEDSGTPATKAPAKAKKGAGDGGAVSGDTGGSGDADETAGKQPAPLSSAKQSK